MTDEVTLTQQLLNDVATFMSTKLVYLGMGTGNDAVTLLSQDVSGPVSISASERNLLYSTATVNGNFIRLHFVVTSTMPQNQPIDYQQIVIHDNPNDTTGMFFGHTFNVPITKDNNSQHDIFISGRVIEFERGSI